MKKTLIKLAFASALSTTALLGAFAPRPAYAFTCASSVQGCAFIGLLSAGDSAACCTYECPDGSQRIRGCIHTF